MERARPAPKAPSTFKKRVRVTVDKLAPSDKYDLAEGESELVTD